MYRFYCWMIGIICGLVNPAIALADIDVDTKTASAAMPLVFVLLIAWGAYKCFAIAKRKTTNTKCAVALGLSLVGYCIISLGSGFKQFLPFSRAFMTIAVLLAFLLFIVSMVLAIIGLIEYKQGFAQGRKQAIWAIVINSIFTLALAGGIVIGVVKHMDSMSSNIAKDQTDSEIKNVELNFLLEMPGKPYIRLKPGIINPNAQVALMRSNPQVLYMLIAERGGVEMDMSVENLAEISQASLKSATQSVTIGKSERVNINGMDGLKFQSDAVVKGKQISYVHWVCSVNGFIYQQIAFAEKKYAAVLIKDAETLFAKFKQIDPVKICYSDGSDPFGRYESTQFGYSLDLSTSSWIKWTTLNEKKPCADTGGLTGNNGAAFFISVLPYGQSDPGKDAIIGAFLQSMAVDRENDQLVSLPEETHDKHNDYIFMYTSQNSGTLFEYKLKISIYAHRAYMLAIWSDKDVMAVDDLYKQVDAAWVVSNPNQPIDVQKLDGHGKLAVAAIINRIGLYFYEKDDNEKAARFFSEAVDSSPGDEVFWDNVMNSLNRLKEHKKAVALIRKHKDKVKLKKSTLSWYAWHLLESGNNPDAVKIYQDLFASDYHDEEDFKHYTDTLAEMGNYQQIDPAYDAFLKSSENAELRLHQAEIWHQAEQYDKALSILNRLDSNEPKVMLKKIYNYRVLKRHKDILPLCEKLIDSGQSPGDAYFHKGRAEYDLKWYAKSKKSFEKSMEYYPKDETIKAYIKELSGILGQGDNSLIKKKIEPIPLPQETQTLLTERFSTEYIKGEGAYYLQHITGYQQSADGVVKSTIRRKIRIVNSAGANDFSTFTIDFNPLYEQLYVNSLIVRDAQGKVVAQGDEDTYYIVDLNDESEKTHKRTLNMPIPQLIPGCTFEIVATRILGNYEAFPFKNEILTSTYPIIFGMVYLSGDRDKIAIDGENGVKINDFNGATIAYVHCPLKYRREPKQVRYDSQFPMVYICGKGTDWKFQGEAYLKKIEKQMVVTADIQKLSNHLTQNIKDNKRRVEKIYRYLQDNYKYMGIEFGTRGEIPYEASRTVKNRYGDCKDHAVLFHHLLESAGVPNYLALVNSRLVIREDMPSRDQFNHIINYIPGDVDRFLDATDKDSSPDLVTPVDLSGLQALVLEPGNVRFVRIPEYKINDTIISVEREYQIEEKMLIVNEVLKLNGYAAAFMRSFLKRKNRDEQHEWGQTTIQSFYPTGKLKDMRINGLEDNSQPVTITMKYSVLRSIHVIKEGLIVNTGGIWEPYYLFSEPVKNRKTGFRIEYPLRVISNNKFEIPEGFALNSLPKAHSSTQTQFGMFETSSSKVGNTIHFQLKHDAESGTFSNEQYQAYYRFNQKIIENASPSLNFTKMSAD